MIERVDLASLAPVVPMARADGAHIEPGPEWSVLRGQHGELLAVGGLLFLPGHRARLRGLWVPPELRGRGYGRRMVEEQLQLAGERGASRVEARTVLWELFERLGFTWTGRTFRWRGPRPAREYVRVIA